MSGFWVQSAQNFLDKITLLNMLFKTRSDFVLMRVVIYDADIHTRLCL